MSEHTQGIPQYNASIGGMPKPSKEVGKIMNNDRLISSHLLLPGISCLNSQLILSFLAKLMRLVLSSPSPQITNFGGLSSFDTTSKSKSTFLYALSLPT